MLELMPKLFGLMFFKELILIQMPFKLEKETLWPILGPNLSLPPKINILKTTTIIFHS